MGSARRSLPERACAAASVCQPAEEDACEPFCREPDVQDACEVLGDPPLPPPNLWASPPLSRSEQFAAPGRCSYAGTLQLQSDAPMWLTTWPPTAPPHLFAALPSALSTCRC